MDNLEVQSFADIDLNDSFFDSLRRNYPKFDHWFKQKVAEGRKAYVFYDSNHKLLDFLSLKNEEEKIELENSTLPKKRRLKVSTFKIISRDTTRGERFIKKILDKAIADGVEEVYVTMFDDEEELKALRHLFERYGFVFKGYKVSDEKRKEGVFIRDMFAFTGDILKDYPKVDISERPKYLISIYPKYHTRLFSDSMLTNEHYDILEDTSETNGIFKTYICWMPDVYLLNPGDKIIIYRTNDGKGSAYYRSVATSLCTVVEVKTNRDFANKEQFQKYCKYSVFENSDLERWYESSRICYVIKMLYNVAFRRRVIRKELIENAGIPANLYWGFFRLTDNQFNRILKLGQIDERYIINQAKICR